MKYNLKIKNKLFIIEMGTDSTIENISKVTGTTLDAVLIVYKKLIRNKIRKGIH